MIERGGESGNMAPEKPVGKSWESWIEEQIRDAEDRGEFADLEGKGKPIPGPATSLSLLDADQIVVEWRRRRKGE